MSARRHSELLDVLAASIEATTDARERDRLRARCVAQLARHGRMDEAQALLAELRQRHDSAAEPAVTPWIIFADALVDRHLGHGDSSLLKMRRAQATSVVAGLVDLQALSASWLAHIFWNREDPDSAVREVRQALRLAAADAHDTRFRASLVVGEMLAMSRRDDLAQPWFARAGIHAQKLRDNAAKSALNYNLAVCRIMMMRQTLLVELACLPLSANSSSHLEASENLDSLLGIPADELSPIPRARLLSMQNRPDLALRIYAPLLRLAKGLSVDRQRSEWLSDEAWCHARLGDFARAREVMTEAEAFVTPATQVDDLASLQSRHALVCGAIGDKSEEARYKQKATELWARYKAFQDRCLVMCEGISPTG